MAGTWERAFSRGAFRGVFCACAPAGVSIGRRARMVFVVIVALTYLLGSIPSGYLVARSRGVDIRRHGSKNIGATNVLRVMGKKWGYLVFACDALKGLASVRLATFVAEAGHVSLTVGGVLGAIA